MVDLQAGFDQQFLDITIRKGVAKVPANVTEDDLGCEVPPLEERRPLGPRLVKHISALPTGFLQHICVERHASILLFANDLLVGLLAAIYHVIACDRHLDAPPGPRRGWIGDRPGQQGKLESHGSHKLEFI